MMISTNGLLSGKTALVTGAGSGIGQALALVASREGANVLVADRDAEGGQRTVALIVQAGGTAHFHAMDAARAADHRAAVAAAQQVFGNLHLACNNAAVSTGRSGTYKLLADVDSDDWDDIVSVGFTGVFHGMQAQIPAILAAGGGAIVNVASIMAQVAGPRLAPYVAAKHGVLGLTRAAAIDYASQNLRVNAVGPGYVDTPMLGRKDAATRARLAAAHPMARLGRPEEIAELALWLLSDRASFVTGAYYPVDGGYLAQ